MQLVKKKSKGLTTKNLAELLKLAEKIKQKALEIDPVYERSFNFSSFIEKACLPYTKIFKVRLTFLKIIFVKKHQNAAHI